MTMTLSPAGGALCGLPAQFVCSRVTLYRSSVVDLRWSRAVHSCVACRRGGVGGRLCSAVHYGTCTPVTWPSTASTVTPAVTPTATPARHVLRSTGTQHSEAAHRVSAASSAASEPNVCTADAFLRQKEAQLKEKRQQAKQPAPGGGVSCAGGAAVPLPAPADEARPHFGAQTAVPAVPPVASPAEVIDQFYFPAGKPRPTLEQRSKQKVMEEAFAKLNGKVDLDGMASITQACGVPLYWRYPLFTYACGKLKKDSISCDVFLAAWKRLMSTCHDEASQFLRLLAKPGCNYITDEDFTPLIQDIVDHHPGLSFLQDAPEFHSRYVQAVVSRIFFCVNKSWTGRVTLNELRNSNFLRVLRLLEDEDEINLITDYFSYEHFYVIYCKFWALDDDHDLLIDQSDLARHRDHAISSRMIDRIFSGAVTRKLVDGKMTYKDFVWFLISEEDKRHPRSIEYWFRCMDLDGDGILSMYEMEFFYIEQLQKMEAMGIETLPFEDCLCQMLDMVKPKVAGQIKLGDLKACKMTPIFFDTFFNLEKYLDQEQKDPFANLRDFDEPDMSDWVRYAAEEYEILVAEEGGADIDECVYEDDFETEDDDELDRPVSNPIIGKRGFTKPQEENDYDFTDSPPF